MIKQSKADCPETSPRVEGCLELVPGACDRDYFQGEGREAGEVGRWLENPPGKIFSPRLALTGSFDWFLIGCH